MSRAFGPAPKPTWWACSWLEDTLILYPRLGCLLPRLQEEARWHRGDRRDLEPSDGQTAKAPCVVRSCGRWWGYPP